MTGFSSQPAYLAVNPNSMAPLFKATARNVSWNLFGPITTKQCVCFKNSNGVLATVLAYLSNWSRIQVDLHHCSQQFIATSLLTEPCTPSFWFGGHHEFDEQKKLFWNSEFIETCAAMMGTTAIGHDIFSRSCHYPLYPTTGIHWDKPLGVLAAAHWQGPGTANSDVFFVKANTFFLLHDHHCCT